MAASLLRDLGTIVDAGQTSGGISGIENGGDDGDTSTAGWGLPLFGGGGDGGSGVGGGGVAMRSGSHGHVDAEGVEKLVARFEILEDEVASVSARRAQSEAQAKVLLATLQRANTKADR